MIFEKIQDTRWMIYSYQGIDDEILEKYNIKKYIFINESYEGSLISVGEEWLREKWDKYELRIHKKI